MDATGLLGKRFYLQAFTARLSFFTLQALEMARLLHPDVVVMDVSMPRLDGVEATRRLKAEMLSVQVIGLSMHSDSDMAKTMCDAGAVAYLNKVGPAEILVETIRSCRNRGSDRAA